MPPRVSGSPLTTITPPCGHAWTFSRSRRTRSVGLLLALTCGLSSVLVGYTASSAAPKPAAPKVAAHPKKPPPNPTNAQLNHAAAIKTQAASDVGRLSGLIAGIDGRISTLNGLAELAGEKYLKAKWDLGLAQAAATKAQHSVTSAENNYATAQNRFRLYIAAAYMNRGSDSSSLLTADNPNILVERSELSRYTSGRQLNALGNMTRATVSKANAVSTAKTAVSLRTRLSTAAHEAQLAAGRAVASATKQRTALLLQKGSYERQLTSAGEALTGLKNKRAAYNAWVIIEAKIKLAAARRAAAARRRLLAAQARERVRLAQAARRRAAAEAAARRRQQHSHSSGGSSGGNSGGSSGGGNSSGGSSGGGNSGGGNSGGGNSDNGGGSGTGVGDGTWSPAEGEAAVHRAERYLGLNYSFDAGGYNGPSYGTCVSGVEWNACHVWGFDCSGLAMYAWAGAGIYMPHYAAAQYSYGNVHPSVDQLQPGDLTFWSSDGTVAGIHHVAIYIGGGQVVEAPHTGDVVKITSLWMSGYFGAVRPGS